MDKEKSMAEQLRLHLANTPKEQLEKEWAEIQAMGLQGPTVDEFIANQEKYANRHGNWIQEVSHNIYMNCFRGSDEMDYKEQTENIGNKIRIALVEAMVTSIHTGHSEPLDKQAREFYFKRTRKSFAESSRPDMVVGYVEGYNNAMREIYSLSGLKYLE